MSQSASPSVSGVLSAIETFSPITTPSYVATFSPTATPSYVASFSPSATLLAVASFPSLSYSESPSVTATRTPNYAPTRIIVQDAVVTMKVEYVCAFAVGIFTIIVILLMKIHELKKVRKMPFTASAPVEPSKVVVNPINNV